MGERNLQLAALISLVAAACVYMLFLEPWGHDTWFHLQRLLDVEQQLDEGRLRAYLSGNAAKGMGLPVWIYYSQWVYWPAIAFRELGANPLIALKVVYCIALLNCCLGCLKLLKLHASETAALFGTLLFITSNYVIGEIFQRAAYAEFLSVSFLPLLLFCMHGVLTEGRNRFGLALVVLAGLMILFHPLSFMNAGPALAAYAVYVVVRRGIPARRLTHLVPWFALALALTAFYWLPAVMETRYVMGEEGVPTRLSETFLSVGRYFNFSSVTNIGPVLTVLFPAVAVSVLPGTSHSERLKGSLPLLVGIVLYVFLTLPLSEPVYENVPLLSSTLWAWRVLYPLILLVVVFVIANLDALPPRLSGPRMRSLVSALAIGQAVVFVTWNSGSELSLGSVSMEEIQQEIAGERSRMEGFGIDEYMPRLDSIPDASGICRTVIEPRSAVVGAYEIRLIVPPGSADACLHIPRLWNVRYEAFIAGREVSIYGDDAGEILVAYSGRSGELLLRLGRPSWARFADVLSVLAMLALAVLAVTGLRRGSRRTYFE